jgi:hypothetical protein
MLCVLLALALAFGAAVMLLLPLNPDDTPRCEQVGFLQDCFDVTKTQQTIQNILAWPAGILGALAALMALVVAVTGRHADTLRKVTIPALVLGILAVVVAQV